MKTTRTVLCALLLLGAIPMAASAQLSVGAGIGIGPHGRASVDLGFFYDNLAPYGNWIERPSHGWVWTPRGVSASWRPYQAGHWVWSDEGWTWLSDEPYGWATYHYGRWYQDPEIGWAWVPGNDWGPAWVSWQEGQQEGQDYVGWAPLPPDANVANTSYNGGYDNGYGDDGGYGYDGGGYGYDDSYAYGGGYYDGGYGYGGGYAFGLAPAAYLFVPVRSFLSVDLFDFFVPWGRVGGFWGFTHNCTSYGFRGGRYYNWGVPFAHVQRYYHNVPRYQLTALDGFRDRGFRADGNRLAFFRPQVERSRGITPLDRPNARGSVMRADQFRAANPDRAARGQQAYNDRQGFRGNEGQGWQGRNGRQGFAQQYQGGQNQGGQTGNGYRAQIDRQRQSDTLQRNRQQVYGQREYDNQRGQAEAQRQQQYDTLRRNQEQVYRQRQYDNSQRWQQNQSSAPRYQNRGYQPQQRQSAPQREYRAPSRGQENRGQSNGGGRGHSQSNDRRHGDRG